jgi:Domain of unknown function (DUF3943)
MIAASRRRHAALGALLLAASAGAGAEEPAAAPPPDLRLQLDPAVLPPGAPLPVPAPSKVMPPAPLYGLLPALEVIGFNVLMNRIAYLSNPEVYGVSLESWKDNLNGPWWYDEDQFRTNQFAHPYQGNIYFNSARSLGRGFWESWGYAIGGSFMWEFFGETEPPSVNDAITTPFGGAILGEVLHRLSNRVLDDGGPRPGFWHEVAAAVLSPANGFNRALYGNRYRPDDLNLEPFVSEVRLALGVAAAGEEGTDRVDGIVPISIGVHLVNGVPGSEFRLRKPLDHYDATFSLTLDKQATTSESYGTILLRGLLLGGQYGQSPSSGLWGLYANYDYVAPPIFRAGSSNLGLGTTGQVDWGTVALQGHALLGVGYGSGGASTTTTGYRDYHFGMQAVIQLEATLYLQDRWRLRWSNREYFTSGRASPEPDSWEDVTYGTTSLTYRVAGGHALGLEAVAARRSAHYPDVPDFHTDYGSLMVAYEYHSDPWMGRGH